MLPAASFFGHGLWLEGGFGKQRIYLPGRFFRSVDGLLAEPYNVHRVRLRTMEGSQLGI
jgi:hypothetical protein